MGSQTTSYTDQLERTLGSGGDMSDLSDLAILRRVIDHVFLPRHTPDARDDVDAMADSHFAFLLVAFFEEHDGLVPRHISAAIRQFHRDRASPPSGPELIERFDSCAFRCGD